MASAAKVGKLIKEARTAAGLTQEQLARKVKGAEASDIGKAERGEKPLTQEQLKQVAKATGVTQKSLLEAAGTTAAKTTGKTTGKTSSAKTSASKTSMLLTSEERKLISLYRKADDKTKEQILTMLKASDPGELISSLLGGKGKDSALGNLLGGAKDSALGSLLGKAEDLLKKD